MKLLKDFVELESPTIRLMFQALQQTSVRAPADSLKDQAPEWDAVSEVGAVEVWDVAWEKEWDVGEDQVELGSLMRLKISYYLLAVIIPFIRCRDERINTGFLRRRRR